MATRRLKTRGQALDPAAAGTIADGLFQSAQPSPINGAMPEMKPEYAAIVETVFTVDPTGSFAQLERELAFDEALTPGAMQLAASRAEDNARRAHKLFVCAKVEQMAFDVECDVVLGAMRDAATAELQKEKDAGQRSKAITEADVKGRAATMYPDEWRDANERRLKAEMMVDHLERLADLWKQRSRTLSAMLGKS